jgi:carbohydrate kinase (thermoresistant glucokinase family)
MSNRTIYIIGVSGSGKSTIGKMLAEKTGSPFFDGDDFHPIENIEKMRSGQALNDGDRQGWLEAINTFANEKSQDSSIIVACSALKKKYRQILRKGIEQSSFFVFLKGDQGTIQTRMERREKHFMPIGLLQTQFSDLETPDSALIIDITNSPKTIIEEIVSSL